jgi:hypothetical protein
MVSLAILSRVTAASSILAVVTASAAILPVVTAPSLTLAVVMAPSSIFAVVTASAAILSVVTFRSVILAVVMADVAILSLVTADDASLADPIEPTGMLKATRTNSARRIVPSEISARLNSAMSPSKNSIGLLVVVTVSNVKLAALTVKSIVGMSSVHDGPVTPSLNCRM